MSPRRQDHEHGIRISRPHPPGQLNAIVKKLGGYDRALRFLRGEPSVCEPAGSWREEDGVIYFSVTSGGMTGEGWIKLFESKDVCVGRYARQALCSPDFKPTSGVTTEIAVLRGVLFEDGNRVAKKIYAAGNKRKFSKPNAELACLIREKFMDKDIKAMGLWRIVAMHEPINDFDGDPSLLSASCFKELSASYGIIVGTWDCGCGFAFAVSQKSS